MNLERLRLRCMQPKEDLLINSRYRYIDNGGKVLAVAHCDYVDCGSNHFALDDAKRLVFCSRLDDRLGVHILLDLLPALGIKCDVLLTDDEETGQSSASQFHPSKTWNWMFQFDRHGDDVVAYEYEDKLLRKRLKKHFTRVGMGSFSDICCLDSLEIKGFNIGTGYYNEHSMASCCDLSVVEAQVMRFVAFFWEFENTKMVHTPSVPRYARSMGGWEYKICHNREPKNNLGLPLFDDAFDDAFDEEDEKEDKLVDGYEVCEACWELVEESIIHNGETYCVACFESIL